MPETLLPFDLGLKWKAWVFQAHRKNEFLQDERTLQASQEDVELYETKTETQVAVSWGLMALQTPNMCLVSTVYLQYKLYYIWPCKINYFKL